jgi:hypothetical protein
MNRLLWIALMLIVVLVLPWAGAWVTHGKHQAAVVAVVWAALVLVGAFMALGPSMIGLLSVAVFQLARTPWQLPTRDEPPR